MRIRTALLACCLLLAVCSSARAQGSREDYERAMSLGQRTNKKILNASVQPHWIDGEGRFWYRRELSERGYEFIAVDAEKGTRQPAFDHEKLAAALSRRLERKIDATRLPIEPLDIAPDGKLVTFAIEGKALACDLESYTLRASDKPAPKTARANIPIRPSGESSVETSLTILNQTAGEIELFWIDRQGERKSYGTIAAGQQREMHTFVGHVWIAVNRTGSILASFAGEPDGTEIVVDGKAGPATAPARERGRRRAGGRDVSPDGRYRAFIRDNNIFLRDLKEDREFALSTDGTAADAYEARFFFSPDSSRLIVLQTQPAEEHKVTLVESSPRDQLQPKLKTIDYLKAGDKIAHPRPRLFDVAARKRIDVADDLFANPWSLEDFRWDEDSSRFTFLYNQRGHQVLRVVAIDARAGKAAALIDEKSDTFIDYSSKSYFQWLRKTPEIVWMSERSGWNHLYLIDAADGKVKNPITSGSWVVKRVERIDETARQVWFWAVGYPDQDPYYLHLGRVNLDGTGLTWLTEADGTHKWDYSPDGKYLIDTWSRVDQPPVSELRRVSDGKLVCELEHADASATIAAGYTVPERFFAKGRDGKTDIFGVIYRPSNFDPAKKYPVVEEIYAGPHDAFVPKSFGRQNRQHAIAELGFIVVQIDGMGTNWRSRTFHDIAWKNLSDAGFEDRIRWIKAAAEKHPEMDLTRVGLYGGSAGGQNALAGLLHHGDFYKVGVADCGCHDNRMDKIWWNEAWMGWPVGKEYAENSNVTHAGKLQGKLLLIFGELDTNVDPSSTMQVVNALVKANKDFELLIIPGQGHGAAETPYGSRRRMDFLVRNLMGKEPRWER